MQTGSAFSRGLAVFPGSIFSFIFPPSCLACTAPLPPGTRDLCSVCLGKLSHAQEGDAIFRRTCQALSVGGFIDGLVAPYYFEKEGPLQQVIHLLKYGGMTVAGNFLGAAIGSELRTRIHDFRSVVIVPVPLHRVKLRERGFNQSEIIARGIARQTGARLAASIVSRVIHTRSQTTLDSIQRARNVEGVFKIRKRNIGVLQGETVLLVDDVITTGATIRSCAMALRPSGVQSIIACAAALAE